MTYLIVQFASGDHVSEWTEDSNCLNVAAAWKEAIRDLSIDGYSKQVIRGISLDPDVPGTKPWVYYA